MTLGEIKSLIKYKNSQAPKSEDHYEELLQDLKKAKQK